MNHYTITEFNLIQKKQNRQQNRQRIKKPLLKVLILEGLIILVVVRLGREPFNLNLTDSSLKSINKTVFTVFLK
jgi:hypothetical protein